MAAGARASGKIAACFVVPGPPDQRADGDRYGLPESTPMLVFAGQNALAQLEREGGYFHVLANWSAWPAGVRVCDSSVTPGDVRK